MGLLESANLNNSHPSPEDGKISSVQMLFASYFESRTMDKVHKPSDSECYGQKPLHSSQFCVFCFDLFCFIFY
jgi:hypothetical protein